MERKGVLEKYIDFIVSNYSKEKREEEIFQLLTEDWSDVNEWLYLPITIQKEFNRGILEGDCQDKKYDEILKFKLRDDCKGFTNEYLSEATGIMISSGDSFDLIACPCCGYKTLETRNEFDICKICWWEDFGQDNQQADEVWYGPNYGVSLTQARYFYQTIGIYNPKQMNLKEIQETPFKFSVGRTFEVDGEYIVEKARNWRGRIETKIE